MVEGCSEETARSILGSVMVSAVIKGSVGSFSVGSVSDDWYSGAASSISVSSCKELIDRAIYNL